MRAANVSGRLALITEGELALDVHHASRGDFSWEPQEAFARWQELRSWADSADLSQAQPFSPDSLGAPVPTPRQVFAIALNYREHAREAGRELPTMPGVFTKFPTCLVGPRATVHLPTETVDWEVELVVVMGARAEQVKEARAWDHVAGLCVGQDISERVLQLGGTFPQLALAKSMPGFGPLGPAVVTPDELSTPDDLALSCSVNAVVQQSARTSDMVFGVPELISRISAICPLLPGDLIFTGTPQGVGGSRTPPEYLHHGDVLVSEIEGIGTLRNVLTSQRQPMMGMAL